MVDTGGANGPGDTPTPVIVLEFGVRVAALLIGAAQPATSAAIAHAAVVAGHPARLIYAARYSNSARGDETSPCDAQFPDEQPL